MRRQTYKNLSRLCDPLIPFKYFNAISNRQVIFETHMYMCSHHNCTLSSIGDFIFIDKSKPFTMFPNKYPRTIDVFPLSSTAGDQKSQSADDNFFKQQSLKQFIGTNPLFLTQCCGFQCTDSGLIWIPYCWIWEVEGINGSVC